MSQVPNWIVDPQILIVNKQNIWPFISSTDSNVLINSITRFLIILFILLLIFRSVNQKILAIVLLTLIFLIGIYLTYANAEKKEEFIYPMPEKLKNIGIIKKRDDFPRDKITDPVTEITSYFNSQDTTDFDPDYPMDDNEKILLRETNDLGKIYPYQRSKGFEHDYKELETNGSFERDISISTKSLYMEPREDYYLKQMHDVV